MASTCGERWSSSPCLPKGHCSKDLFAEKTEELCGEERPRKRQSRATLRAPPGPPASPHGRGRAGLVELRTRLCLFPPLPSCLPVGWSVQGHAVGLATVFAERDSWPHQEAGTLKKGGTKLLVACMGQQVTLRSHELLALLSSRTLVTASFVTAELSTKTPILGDTQVKNGVSVPCRTRQQFIR